MSSPFTAASPLPPFSSSKQRSSSALSSAYTPEILHRLREHSCTVGTLARLLNAKRDTVAKVVHALVATGKAELDGFELRSAGTKGGRPAQRYKAAQGA